MKPKIKINEISFEKLKGILDCVNITYQALAKNENADTLKEFDELRRECALMFFCISTCAKRAQEELENLNFEEIIKEVIEE